MPRVLLCDDDAMNRKVASKILHKEGFEVTEAVNGQEALKQLSQLSVNLILMDVMMPVLDGYAAIKQIKATPELASIPLIVISALSDDAAIEQGLTLGADAYITKPYNITEFCRTIHTLVQTDSHV
ncbi:MAG: hypothetical protein DSZ03_00585 [Sulfurimonas sp.]|nr:MAG: hypothetical protein DSZ03_00585 [Sulfurimonas sp.]